MAYKPVDSSDQANRPTSEHEYVMQDISSLGGGNYNLASTLHIGNPSSWIPSPLAPRRRQTGFTRLSWADSTNDLQHAGEATQGEVSKSQVGLGITDADSTHSFQAGLDSMSIRPSHGRRGVSTSTAASSANSESHLLPHKHSSSEDTPENNLQPRFSISSRKSFNDFTPHCPSRSQLIKPASDFVYITLLVLSIFSTVFSCLYLIIALWRPEYGTFIQASGGNLTPSSASLVFNLFAKLIELSFLTVFVAFVGQVVSRKAFKRPSGKGVTLAEMSMRSWILQPSIILTHINSVKFVLTSVTGIAALLAAVSAVFYTSAASVLVTPQLSIGRFATREMQATVRTDFGNVTYVENQCKTPISFDPRTPDQDYDVRLSTCLAEQFAASSYKDTFSWYGQWTQYTASGRNSSDMRQRPPPTGLFNENTQVQGSWIDIQDMHNTSAKWGRWVNNVTVAMPHVAIVGASTQSVNKILQPRDSSGLGSYDLHAGVPSPVLNVVCVGMSKEEMAPMVYSEWPAINGTRVNYNNWTYISGDSSQVPSYPGPNQYINATVVDDIFRFGEKYGEGRRMPVFARLPDAYNTILNSTGVYTDRDYIWLLGAPPANVSGYALCGLRASQTPMCSTWYNTTNSGDFLSSWCEDPDDPLQYIKLDTDATTGADLVSIDWAALGDSCLKSTALNDGITGGNASHARILTELIPTSTTLSPDQPSIAEALAVIAGGSLLVGARDAPINSSVLFAPSATPVVNQTFMARVRSQQYASGAEQGWQDLLFIVLFAVAFGNLLVLGWLILARGLITDYCDPANLFALGINSPPSAVFAGSCGGGPSNEQARARWYLAVENDHVFLENDEGDTEKALMRTSPTAQTPEQTPEFGKTGPSPIMQAYARLSKHKSFL